MICDPVHVIALKSNIPLRVMRYLPVTIPQLLVYYHFEELREGFYPARWCKVRVIRETSIGIS